MRKCFFCLLILLLPRIILAQTKPTIDNLTVKDTLSTTDSTRGKRLEKVMKVISTDMKRVVGLDTLTPQTRPKITLLRSLIVPGWGQIMNKDYWKLPLVYGAAAGGIWVINQNSKEYHYYLNHVEILEESGQNAMPPLNNPTGRAISKETYARAAATYKRYRDLSRIGFGVGWLLFAVEANVAAHLKNFDISDNIALKWEAHSFPVAGGYYANGIKVSLTLK